jgi:copper chaperone CopZ
MDSMDHDCRVERLQKNVNDGDLNEARMATLAIWGMDCHNCVTRVRNSLLRLDGAVSADIDFERGLAFVDYVPTKTDPHALILAVASAGDDGRHNYYAALIT